MQTTVGLMDRNEAQDLTTSWEERHRTLKSQGEWGLSVGAQAVTLKLADAGKGFIKSLEGRLPAVRLNKSLDQVCLDFRHFLHAPKQ